MTSSFLAKRSKQKEKWLRTTKPPEYSVILDKIRPEVQGTRKNRFNKAEVYKQASEIAKSICISGSYCGLAAAYSYEIRSAFKTTINGLFVNCENNKKLANQLKDYTSILSWLYNMDFSIYQGNIFDCLASTKHKFSIVDLDLMSCLATPNYTAQQKIEPIVKSLENAVSNRFLLILWSCYGMKALTEERYDQEVRPTLIKTIREKYKILRYRNYKYCDNHIPIKVEILGLEQRRKK